MVLTEPGAGSDVGAGTTRARSTSRATSTHLEGVKRFITNGDFDYPENIVHMVLARPEGAGPGTKGLSLFIVPKFWVEADGSLGARNGAVVTQGRAQDGHQGLGDLRADPRRRRAVPRPPGRRASTTASRQMFHVIEYARMGVGTKSMATLSTAYLNALDYARERKQGARPGPRPTDKTAPRVEIIRHPDVRADADDAEGVRRGPARDGAVDREHPGPGRAPGGHGSAPTPSSPTRSTT